MRAAYTAIAVGALLAMATPAWAQSGGARISRGDAVGTLGWLNARQAVPEGYGDDDDWYNRSLYGGASFGWYWTDHWKSEIDGGATTRAELRGGQTTFVGGRQDSIYSTYGFSTSRIALGQQYQFFRNVWVHPFIGGGIDFTWESIDQFDQVFSSFPTPATVRIDHPDRSEFHTRPFATVGLKAYMTPHGFFRTDVKFVADSHGLDEVTLRFGFGIDF